jgi:uncharacterized protein YkwD
MHRLPGNLKPFECSLRYTAVVIAAVWLTPISITADPAPSSPPDLSQIERNVEKGIDARRESTGRPTFRSDATVAKIARRHSRDMAKGKVGFGHDGLQDRVEQVQKHYEIAGAAENVSKHQRKEGHAEAAVNRWLESPVHLKNIDGNHDLSGVGAAVSEDGTVFITQIFVNLR